MKNNTFIKINLPSYHRTSNMIKTRNCTPFSPLFVCDYFFSLLPSSRALDHWIRCGYLLILFKNIIQSINQTYDYNILLYYLRLYSVLAERPISKSFIFPNDETWIFLKSKIPKKRRVWMIVITVFTVINIIILLPLFTFSLS